MSDPTTLTATDWLEHVHSLLTADNPAGFHQVLGLLCEQSGLTLRQAHEGDAIPAELLTLVATGDAPEGPGEPVQIGTTGMLLAPFHSAGRPLLLLELGAGSSPIDPAAVRSLAGVAGLGFPSFARQEKLGLAHEAVSRIISGAQDANGVAMETLCGASQVTTHVTAVASASEEMLATINEIGARSAESAEISREAHELSVAASKTVDRLLENSEAIGQITSLIGELTSQTNLLALNATIEAARAGDAGRGFAVVAGEVKALARQTASATEGINQQIEAIQSGVRECAREIESVSKVIVRVDEAAGAIAAAVQEQGSAVEEISTMISAASDQLSGVVERLSDVGEATMSFESDARVCSEAL
jgi:hypothetical protein